jgi:small subunit ribosomal protein S16
MSVKLRFKRLGRSHGAFFRLSAIDSRSPRDGRVIEELGTYDPILKDKTQRLKVDLEKCKAWLDKGAIPSETVSSHLKRAGLEHKGLKLRRVGTHTVKAPPAKKA